MTMNTKTRIITALCLFCLLSAGRAHAQWVVTDPGNLAQGIINAAKNIVHTSSTAGNMLKNFQETVKIYQQGKEYYDGLRKVKNLVRDARKVQQTILMVGDITEIYVTSYERMLSDPYFTPEELSAIALGYTKLLEESAHLLTDLKTVVNENGLSMNDKERMAYVKAPESWEDLERSKLSALDGNPVLKLQRLKGTRILRLAAYAGPKSRCPGNYVPIDTFMTDESGARSFAHSSMRDTLLVTLLRKGKAE